jgi:deoxyribodipyrimidine photolyase
MQQSQRAEANHALEYAIGRANARGEPLVVGFGLTDGYPGANLRHYRFLLEGLVETARDLNDKWFLDGRDPSSYANVGWLFGLHDRPWPERDVYGTVRTMTRAALERKVDLTAWARLTRSLPPV